MLPEVVAKEVGAVPPSSTAATVKGTVSLPEVKSPVVAVKVKPALLLVVTVRSAIFTTWFPGVLILIGKELASEVADDVTARVEETLPPRVTVEVVSAKAVDAKPMVAMGATIKLEAIKKRRKDMVNNILKKMFIGIT